MKVQKYESMKVLHIYLIWRRKCELWAGYVRCLLGLDECMDVCILWAPEFYVDGVSVVKSDYLKIKF